MFYEKKSRFIGYISAAHNESDALRFLSGVREKHPDATHNVYAYRIKNGACRHSDDGEPPGTAGMPLLSVFLKQDIYDFCCVATRYFGGVLLGTGGLTHAYARCGTMALEAAGIGEMREMVLCEASLPYSMFDAFERSLERFGAVSIVKDFAARVDLRFSLPPEEAEKARGRLTELSAGTVDMYIKGKIMSIGALPES